MRTDCRRATRVALDHPRGRAQLAHRWAWVRNQPHWRLTEAAGACCYLADHNVVDGVREER